MRKSKLGELRKKRGMTQMELSLRSGVSYRLIQHYEQRQKDINKAAVFTVARLAAALGCEMSDILNDGLKYIKNGGGSNE